MFRIRSAVTCLALGFLTAIGAAQAAPAVSTAVAFSLTSTAGNLVKGADGAFYGTGNPVTSVAGGIIWRATADGSDVRTLYQLNPETDAVTPGSGLLLASDGLFYGTTKFGKGTDSAGAGSIFKIAPSGTGFAIIHRFAPVTATNSDFNPVNTNGAYPEAELIEGQDGMLYGVARAGGANGTGTIFRIQRDGTGFEVLRVLDKSKAATDSIANTEWSAPAPSGDDGVNGVSGYSTAVITAYKRSASAPADNPGAITYTFATSDWTPANGWSASIPAGSDPLYAVSATANSQGATDTVAATEWSARVLLGQDGAEGLRTAPVFLYQRTATNVAPAVATANSTTYTFATNVVSGQPAGWTTAIPDSAAGAFLWVIQATASNTVAANAGQIFNADGAAPTGQLVQDADGYLYGTASGGGSNGRGTVFRLAADGTGFQVLHHFTNPTTTNGVSKNADGIAPFAGLTDGGDGFLYGVASQAGPNGFGTIYSIKLADRSFGLVFGFSNSDGARPVAELTRGTDGKLYGTTASGGEVSGNASTLGTFFSIDGTGSNFTTLHDFEAKDGTAPSSRVIQQADGVFYGLASSSGNCGYGTLWRYSAAGDTVTGNTKCGQKKGDRYGGGGGSVGFVVLTLLGGLGLYRRRAG
jgi:uncharacterized repeat protein (TIGR03803 family)